MGNKIKIIVSDFHIGKGRYLSDGRRNILEDFLDDRKFIEFLNYYGGDNFKDKDVELICNGDFFNILQVDASDTHTNMITEDISAAKMELIIQGHPELMDALKEFVSKQNCNVVLIVGNHDAALLWPDVQKILRDRIGSKIRFIDDFYVFDTVFVTHGHRYEFLNHFNPKDFWYEGKDKERYMRLPWGSYFVVDFLNRMKKTRPYIDKIKPFRMYLRFAFWNDFRFFWKMIINIVKFWFRNRFQADPYRRREFRLSFSRIADALTHESMFEAVKRILRNTSYRIIIMGHSHSYDFRQFGVDGEYFNTGTWTETISLDIQTLGRNLDRTYVIIEYDAQGRPLATLKRWNGQHRVEEDLRV